MSSSHFRKGVGSALVRHAKERMGARFVDVNEQNPQAIAFYEKIGFKAFDRGELDGSGAPYPIIKMRL